MDVKRGELAHEVGNQMIAKGLLVVVWLALAAQMSSAQGMMRRQGGMMGGEGMREMMQRMMGDMLPPPMDPADLPEPRSDGAQLLQKFCTQCHYLPGPGLHTADEWPPVVDRMNRRMQMMGGDHMMMGRIEAPTEKELAAIVAYLQKHAQKPLPAGEVAGLAETEGGRLFGAVCSRCHTLPDPKQHVANDWPVVVARMQRYMTEAGRPLPSDQEMRQIIDFLRKNARAPE